ncbi:MAG TPA: multicopper oxidase domain-containing protein, partial [Thermoanaerobaculia bacterium]|nr:multicopper oxidase domain-containing protein [Thermoanaerobaculia bacterium]
LAPSDGDCIWREHGCDGCNAIGVPHPECCLLVTRPQGMNCFHGQNSTNIHFHGMHISPQKPQDWVLLQLHPPKRDDPGAPCDGVNCYGQFQYRVDPVRDHQSEGTHWYHPHKHGSTAAQLGNGMAGAIIVEGPFDDWLNRQFKRKLRERTLVIQQIHDLNFTSTATISGEIPLINGLLMPSVTMYPGEIQRWRVVSATMEASAQIAIDFNSVANTPVRVKQIAMDGVRFSDRNYQCQPLLNPGPQWTCTGFPPDPKFYLSPGNRADFLVRAPDREGTYMISYDVFGAVERQGLDTKQPPGGHERDLTRTRQMTREALDSIAPGDLQPALLSIKVIACPPRDRCERMEFPPKLRPMPEFLETIVPTDPGHKLQFQIVRQPQGPPTLTLPPPPGPNALFGVWLKGPNRVMQFQEDCAAVTLPLNPRGGQKWEISQNVNTIVRRSGVPGAPLHVFHMHTNPFQVVSTVVRDQKITYPEPIWMDSVTVPNNRNDGHHDPERPSGQVEILQRFQDFTGQFVLHCHFLGHEDRGMMLSVQTVCPQRQDAYSVPSPDQQECVGEFLKALPPCLTTTPATQHH